MIVVYVGCLSDETKPFLKIDLHNQFCDSYPLALRFDTNRSAIRHQWQRV